MRVNPLTFDPIKCVEIRSHSGRMNYSGRYCECECVCVCVLVDFSNFIFCAVFDGIKFFGRKFAIGQVGGFCVGNSGRLIILVLKGIVKITE